MKKIIFLVFAALSLPVFAQSNGVYNANTYAYTTQVTSGNASTGSSSLRANPTAFAQGIPFLPYNLNASITINRNAATAETVTPSAIANCFPNSLTCTLSGTFSFKHISGESIQSGTFGLQEALNIAVANGSGTVLIDASWGGPTGTSLITAAKGSSSVMIQDNRNPSGATFYQWNGSAYAATGGGGGAVTSVFGRTGAVSAQTGDYSCAQVTGCTSGITSINGDTTAAQLFHASGTGLTVATAGGVTTYTLTGGAGSGAVATGLANQCGAYLSNGTTISPAVNLWCLNPSMSGAQLTTFLGTLTPGSDIVLIPPAFGQKAFSNVGNVQTWDYRRGAAIQQMSEYGLSCDAQHFNITLTGGSNQVAVGSSLSAANVGNTFFIGEKTGFGVDAPQYSWTPTVTAYTFPNATLSAVAPSALNGFSANVWVGTDNTVALNQAIAQSSSTFPVMIPAGCFMLSQQLTWGPGNVIVAQSPKSSGIVMAPGQDGLQQADAANGAVGTGQLKNAVFLVDGTIDRAQGGYTAYNAAGTPTTVAPLYRPIHMTHQDANNPLGPGWAKSAIVGVASTTQNTAVICYSTASGQKVPVVGNQIVFRDFPTGVYVTTVSSLSGSGCSGTTSPATLAAVFPNTSGYTQSQIEWLSTSSVLTSSTALPSTINYPFTITVNQSIAPVPGFESNVAQHGHVFIAGQQFDYLGVSYTSPYTITLQRGPSSCAGADCSTGFAILPGNPCEANWTVPYPVTPTINSGDSTPHGANYFPALCGGNFAVSFPQANGNTNAGPGLSNGLIDHLTCTLVEGPQDANNNGCVYFAGNANPYGSELGSVVVNFLDYGIASGPASYGMHGVEAVGPTGAGNSIHDCSIHAAYPITLSDFENGKIDRCDTYPSATNPYDGSAIGNATWLSLDDTLDEQTGGVVTNVSLISVASSFGEPENGSHIENPPSVQSDAIGAIFTNNNFEGGFNIFGGSNQKIVGGQLSNPVILYGSDISIENVSGLAPGFITNLWPSQFINWGQNNDCSYYTGQGSGPIASCGTGLIQSFNGHDAFGVNPVHPNNNILGGVITMNEWLNVGLPTVFDPTELWWGQHAECGIGSGIQCGPFVNWDGFNGPIPIGPWQRITDAPMHLFANVSLKNSGSASVTLSITAQQPGSCANPNFNLANLTFTATFGVWTPIDLPVDFTGTIGCELGVQFEFGSATNVLEIGYFNFLPAPTSIPGPISAPTEGAACPKGSPASSWLGAFSGFTYFCDGGTVKRAAII